MTMIVTSMNLKLNKFNVNLLKLLLNDVLQGTILTVCNYSCHFDPKYWTEPQKFNPERFLGEDGKFQAPKSGFFAFGQGNFTLKSENNIGRRRFKLFEKCFFFALHSFRNNILFHPQEKK